MRKKYIIGTLLLLTTMVAVGGCAQPTAPPAQVVTIEVPVVTEVPGDTVIVTVEVPVSEEPAEEEPIAPLGPVTLQFTGWTYDLEKVEDNLATFQDWVATEADVPVETGIEWSDSGFGEFDTHVTTANAAGNEFDVLYGSDHWLAKWAEAGWVVPIEEHFPEILDYIKDIAPYSVEAMTYDGKLYGLPYYTDAM